MAYETQYVYVDVNDKVLYIEPLSGNHPERDFPLTEDQYITLTHMRSLGNMAFYDGTGKISYETDPEQVDILRSAFKRDRQNKLNTLTVIVDGHEFDADEDSRNRLTSALMAMDEEDTIEWTMADNKVATLDYVLVKIALKTIGQAQTEIWRP